MMLVRPRTVSFAGTAWEDVQSVAIDRTAAKIVTERSELGMHAVFVDIQASTVRAKIRRSFHADELDDIRPGDDGDLRFDVSLASSDIGRVRVTMAGVVTEVRNEVSGSDGIQTVTIIGVSADGRTDPVIIEPA